MKVKRKQQLALFLFLLGMICLLSGTSYAFYEVLYEGRIENKLEAGSFAIAFENKSDSITLDNAYPMSDEEGNKINPFGFSITNNGSLASRYQLSIEEDSKNTLSRGYLKYSLKRNNTEELATSSTLSSLVLVENKELNPSATDNYELRIWIDEKTGNEAMNKIWKGKVKLVAHDHNVEYIEDHVAPTIKLSGDIVMDLHLNDPFTDPGVEEVTDNVDQNLNKENITKRYEYYDGEKVSTVSNVDTTKEGVYIIYYEIKDSNGNKGVAARTINVVKVNKNAPTITLIGESTLTYARGDYYVERGATAKDEQNNDLTNQIIVIHNLNLNIEEEQIVKYFVIDKDGNIGGATRKIQVVPAYKDNTNANEPKIVEGMIPVVYDEGLGKWKKADMTSFWYNYEEQKWANAVTIGLDADESNTKRKEYQTAEAGTAIEMDDINTMWVWIPRYEYKYTNLGNQYAGGKDYMHPGEIGINFIRGTSNKVSDENNYKMHPAFTFGEQELTGLWYGKFEASNEEQKFTGTTGSNSSELTPIIKPNATSWRSAKLANMFYAAFNMKSESNVLKYGFNGSSVDTHMSKNSEWGAVAYLSQSIYGKYGNDGQEVYINNCSSYITGIAGDTADAGESVETCENNTYETIQGQKASVTGNITGVYDMSGGAYEYVMGALSDGQDPAKPRSGLDDHNSGFNGVLHVGGQVSNERELPDKKYYDLYTSNDPNSYIPDLVLSACEGNVCYGHALSETTGWYSDNEVFLYSLYPWLARGGDYYMGSSAGMFASGRSTGAADTMLSFRIVLVS